MTHHIRHFVFPQESNNQRGKALHFSSLFFYIAVLLVIQFSLSVILRSAPNVLGIASDISIDRLLSLTNQQRIEAGLQPLKINENLSKAATKKAEDMFQLDYWAHNSPHGKTPWDFIIGADYKYLYAGENLAKDFANSDGVVSAWMKSPSHRENILQDKYDDIGFAVVNGKLNGEETTLVVQMFGKREETPKGVISQAVNSATTQKIIASHPSLDIFQITKSLSLFFGLFLTALVALDAFIIYRKKLVRISGHSLSHLIFLFALVAVIWMTGKGVVI